jgi:nucleoside-diphosphate-sugar epimerase
VDRVLIVGCGDIGRRVARLWGARGAAVFGLARSPESAARLSRLGITPVPGDLDDRAALRGLPARGALVYHFAPPPADGETDPRTRALVEAVPDGDEPEKLVYMSTTGVYGDLKGGWATEETPAVPETDRGRRRLDAENVLRAWGRERKVPVVVLRVAGIYGPGRLPVEAIRRGTPVLAEAVAPYTNRIHAEDLARVCVAAAERGPGGSIYNVSDGVPGTITEYFHAVADRFGLPRPPAVGLEESRKVLSPSLLSYLSESRRIDSRRMREELGVALLYPTLAEGLAASLEDGG